MQILKNKSLLLIFILIILIGSFLRLYRIENVPAGITLDEISIGYNAFTLSTEGVDQDGRAYPLTHFRSLADYKLPFQFYAVAILQKILGNTALTIRLPGALFGMATIVATYFLANAFFGRNVALAAAFLFAISPWHAFHSHLGLETNTALFFATCGILFLQLSLHRENLLYICAIFFVLAVYTHHIYWIFLPIFIPCFFVLHKDFFKKDKKTISRVLIMVVVLLLPLLTEKQSNYAGRINQSTFSQKGAEKMAKESNELCKKQFACFWWSFTTKYFTKITSQYSLAYSINNWYNESGFDNTDVMPDRGLFYFFELPLFLVGLVLILRSKKKDYKFLLVWLFLYPLPLLITGSVSAPRMYQLLPLPQMLEGLALVTILRRYKSAWLIAFPVIAFSVIRFASDLFYLYPSEYNRYTDYNQRVVLEYVKNHSNKTLYVEHDLLHRLYVLYFFKVSPKEKGIEPENSNVDLHYKNLTLLEKGYGLLPNYGALFISRESKIPSGYTKIGELVIDGFPFADISESL